MNRTIKGWVSVLFTVTALLYGGTLLAQDAPPAGGFKNPYLTVNSPARWY